MRECLREENQICMSLLRGWGEGRLKSNLIPLTNTMLYMMMRYQINLHQPHPSLRALHYPLQSLLVGGTDPRQSPRVFQLRQYARDETGLTGNDHHLPCIFMETYLVEYFCKDV